MLDRGRDLFDQPAQRSRAGLLAHEHDDLAVGPEPKPGLLAPQRIDVPSGSSVEIDYTQSPPVLAVKLQEMFGCAETPRIASGRVSPTPTAPGTCARWTEDELYVRVQERRT
jgi:hypothetical protein